jgi:hypothetical protein
MRHLEIYHPEKDLRPKKKAKNANLIMKMIYLINNKTTINFGLKNV